MSKNIFSALHIDNEDQEIKANRVSRKKHPVVKIDEEIIMSLEIIMKEKFVHDKKTQQKIKGVPSQPHPLDRHSGTGRGKELRKEGVGRHNWGTYKDDFKFYDQYMNEEEQTQGFPKEILQEQQQQQDLQSEKEQLKRIRIRKNKSTIGKIKELQVENVRPQQLGLEINEIDFPPLMS